MTTLGIIEQYISTLQKNIKILKGLQKYSQKKLKVMIFLKVPPKDIFTWLHRIALSEKMVGVVKFRNVITHDHKKIDYKIVYNVLHRELRNG